MDIDTRIRELGAVDCGALVRTILAQEEAAWREQEHRQNAYEVHRATESLVMVFTDDEAWPELMVKKEAGWCRLADAALPVMHDIIGRFYPPGGAIVRAMAAKLKARGQDQAPCGQPPLIPHRPPDSCAHHHQPAGSLHHRRAAPIGCWWAKPMR